MELQKLQSGTGRSKLNQYGGEGTGGRFCHSEFRRLVCRVLSSKASWAPLRLFLETLPLPRRAAASPECVCSHGTQ